MARKTEKELKRISIRVPKMLWRRLKVAQLNEQIKSIQQAVVDGLILVLREKRGKDD